jgi:signal transduction histidine kinase
MYVARPGAPRPRCYGPDAILAEVARDLTREAESRGVRIVAELPAVLAVAWIDPDAIRQVAEALARNALEASSSGQTVRLIGRSTPRRLSWLVGDEGEGLTRRTGRHLLDPFYCGRDAGRGLGLGLSRAARFIARGGGRLRWRSGPGRGTVFHVLLPLDAVPESEGQAGPPRAGADGEPLRATG